MTASVSGGITLILKLPLNMLSSSLGCSARKTTNKLVFKSWTLLNFLQGGLDPAAQSSSFILLSSTDFWRHSHPPHSQLSGLHFTWKTSLSGVNTVKKTKGPRPRLLAKKTNWVLKACCYTSERRLRTRCCTCADTLGLIHELKGSHGQSSISLFSFLFDCPARLG